jgi:hypothetical protein
VELRMQFCEAEAPTAIAAVSLFLVEILYHGMSGMTFTVRDRYRDIDDPAVFVQNGQVCSSDESGAELHAKNGSQGRPAPW